MTDPMSFLESVAGYMRNAPDTTAGRPIRLATIDPSFDPFDFPGTLPLVTFDGESTMSGKRYPVFAPGYTPSPSDRVVMLPAGNTYVIIGALDAEMMPGSQDRQTFTANGTWNNPGSGLVYVECQGGGGAGGGAAITAAGQAACGGGAQGGAYAASWFLATDLASTESVTRGAGGNGVTGGSGNGGNTSSFSSGGTLVSAAGGTAGTGGAATATPGGTSGATSGQSITGQIQIPGSGGGYGVRPSATAACGGHGGNSHKGAGGAGVAATTGNAVGVNGTGKGGGGGGAANAAGQGAGRAGGDGADGAVWVTTWL